MRKTDTISGEVTTCDYDPITGGIATAGWGGGGGTFLNCGYSKAEGLPGSITAIAGGGGAGGFGFGLGFAGIYTNASTVADLLGGGREANVGIGPIGTGYIQSADGTVRGGSVVAYMPRVWPANSFVGPYSGVSTTSAIIQWTRRCGWSLGATENDAIIP